MSVLDRYGIKEVADVTFYELSDAGKPEYPVLYLDTLKVSTIEQTAETAEARGGKGNAALISWDYGKEINVTLEDALFSAKSMAIMFGNGTVGAIPSANNNLVMRTETWVPDSALTGITYLTDSDSAVISKLKDGGWNPNYIANGSQYGKKNPKVYDATGSLVSAVTSGEKYFVSYDLAASGSVIEISANSFPGTYYITGDTYARSEASGHDEFFQFIIPKAKVTSENTITLEAEGDPSVFNMSLKVLRPEDGVMMKLVKYNLTGGTTATETASTWIHNHTLNA